MSHSSKRAVLTAIASNFTVTVIKFIAGLAGGSASMINEAVHSLMDTLNQGFLFLGLRESEKPADQLYAFGHGQKKYLWNLWSAIGLFSIGAGLGLAHAWHSWEGLGNSHLAETVSLFGVEMPASVAESRGAGRRLRVGRLLLPGGHDRVPETHAQRSGKAVPSPTWPMVTIPPSSPSCWRIPRPCWAWCWPHWV